MHLSQHNVLIKYDKASAVVKLESGEVFLRDIVLNEFKERIDSLAKCFISILNGGFHLQLQLFQIEQHVMFDGAFLIVLKSSFYLLKSILFTGSSSFGFGCGRGGTSGTATGWHNEIEKPQ